VTEAVGSVAVPFASVKFVVTVNDDSVTLPVVGAYVIADEPAASAPPLYRI
jgi:hypothetical protein